MTAPRPLCAWCGLPLGRGAPAGMGASMEASWHKRGMGVPTIGWHMGAGEGAPTCWDLDPLAKLHGEHGDDVEPMLAEVAARGPGRLVRASRSL